MYLRATRVRIFRYCPPEFSRVVFCACRSNGRRKMSAQNISVTDTIELECNGDGVQNSDVRAALRSLDRTLGAPAKHPDEG